MNSWQSASSPCLSVYHKCNLKYTSKQTIAFVCQHGKQNICFYSASVRIIIIFGSASLRKLQAQLKVRGQEVNCLWLTTLIPKTLGPCIKHDWNNVINCELFSWNVLNYTQKTIFSVVSHQLNCLLLLSKCIFSVSNVFQRSRYGSNKRHENCWKL